jgi:hypothetical protein
MTTTCAGNTFSRCSTGGIVSTDCAQTVTGGTCLTAPEAGTFGDNYCGTATACTHLTTPMCDGTKINFCAGGAMTTVDCAAIGFTTCVAGKCL